MKPQEKFKIDEAFLQKFTNKMERLIENKQSEQSEEPDMDQQNPISEQEESSVTPIKKITPFVSNDTKQKLRSSNLGSSSEQNNGSHTTESNQESIKKNTDAANTNQNQVIQIDDNRQEENQEAPKSEKIDIHELAKLIAIEKKKAQEARQKLAATATTVKKITPNNSKNTKIDADVAQPQVNFVKPTVRLQSSNSQKNSNSDQISNPKSKTQFKMPKVATMNNLIKLSTKLNQRDMLKEIKYRASVTSLGPTRLLLYFGIQRILYYIYQTNGAEKVNQKIKDTSFLTKQITLGLIDLIRLLGMNERTMICRILVAVFMRLGISQVFSNRWLTDCVRANRQLIQAAGVNPDTIQSPPASTNITSNIFIGIPTVTSVNYAHLNLDLQNQNDSQERIQDPQSFHIQQKLFFFKENSKKPKNSPKQQKKDQTKISKTIGRTTRAKNNEDNQRIQQFYQQQYNYKPQIQIMNYDAEDSIISETDIEPSSFTIEFKKIEVPLNIRIFSNLNNPNQYDINKRPKGKQLKNDEQQRIVSKKRNRQTPHTENLFQECKIDRKDGLNNISEQKIKSIIQEHIFNNMDYIADKMAEKLNIKPQKLKQFIKQCDQANTLPSKSKAPTLQSTKEKRKNQTDNDIIKSILAKQVDLQRKNVNRKQIVKQILLFLQSKMLDDDKKQKILDKWIEIKKQRQKQSSKNSK